MTAARWAHATVAVVSAVALVWQLVLVVSGAAVLVPESDPGVALRLVRFASYFTIQSNALILVSSILLARDPARGGRFFDLVRLAGLTGIVVTAIVHWFFLRPILQFTGASYAVDKLLHVVVPLLAVLVWIAFGPRRRTAWRSAPLVLLWPAGWLAWILVFGALTRWYPYPFLDVGARGAGNVMIAALLVAALIAAATAVVVALERVLPSGVRT